MFSETIPYRLMPIPNIPFPFIYNFFIQLFIGMIFVMAIGLMYALGTWPFNLSEDV